jgi:acetyl esterase/lipase
MPPAQSRELFVNMFDEVPRADGISYVSGNIGGIQGLWAIPTNAPVDKAILYAHGGGYVIGSPEVNVYAATIGHLATFSGLQVFAPDYRKAPEFPYPAGPDDILSAYQGLLDKNINKVVVAGDSAGGGLAMSLLLNCKQRGIRQPAGAVLWSPWLDLHCESESHTFNQPHDPTLDNSGLVACRQHYVGDSIPDDPILHPLTTDLGGLPPVLIQVGSIEILLGDATRFAARAGAAGVRVHLHVYPNMPHVFQGFYPALEESGEALDESARFINHCLS